MMTPGRQRQELVCQQAVELATEYLEGALPRSERKRFRHHLRHCPDCTIFFEQLQMTIRATGSLHGEELSSETREEFTELFHRWRGDRDGGGEGGGGGEGVVGPGRGGVEPG